MTDTQVAIWAFVTVLGLAFTAFTVVGAIAFYRGGSGQPKSFGLLFERGNFLRLLTATLVILGVVILALTDKLEKEGTVAILSGVAGYVLGGLTRQQTEKSESNTEEKG